MSLQTRLIDFITAVGTDYKQLRTWITGSSTGNLTSLNTTAKDSIVSAINEVKAGNSGSPPTASESVAGVSQAASLAEMAEGTSQTNKYATPAGVRQERLALKDEILGGVGPAYDTLAELLVLAEAGDDTQAIADLITVVGGKANAADVYSKIEIGDPDTDLAAAYFAAKA